MITRCTSPRICARARAERNNGAQRFGLCDHCQRVAIMSAMGLTRTGRAIISKGIHVDVGASSSNDIPPPLISSRFKERFDLFERFVFRFR